MLAVSDNGCGMDKETLQYIFDPFYSTKETGKGTGLGLSTVYGIVKQNKGFINVYSESGKGTVFKIYLSRHGEEIAADVDLLSSKATMGNGELILLVEDEPSLLHLNIRMLESLGYRVLSARRPDEALRLAASQEERVDLLITDVVMPEMNGRTLAEKIQAILPGIRTLFISAYTANVIAHHGILENGVQFLQKPFSKNELAKKVRESISAELLTP